MAKAERILVRNKHNGMIYFATDALMATGEYEPYTPDAVAEVAPPEVVVPAPKRGARKKPIDVVTEVAAEITSDGTAEIDDLLAGLDVDVDGDAGQ